MAVRPEKMKAVMLAIFATGIALGVYLSHTMLPLLH